MWCSRRLRPHSSCRLEKSETVVDHQINSEVLRFLNLVDCPEHNIISDLVQDIHKEELMDDLLSNASSDSFEEAKGI